MTEDDKRNCCLVEIQETEAKYYKTLEDIEKVSVRMYVQHVNIQYCISVVISEHLYPGTSNLVLFSFCNLSFVGSSGLWVGSQHGNVSGWHIHWGAKTSQELINMVIIGLAPTGHADPWGFFAYHMHKDKYCTYW